MARFSSTCSSCTGSTITGGSDAGSDGADLDVVAQQSPQHRPQVLDHAADVERPWLQHLAAAEGQQLLRQRGGALAGLEDVAGVDAQRVGLVQPRDDQLRVAVDHRQQVVEVVRDATGELADGLHLLRLDQLLLELLLGADVVGEHEPGPAALEQRRVGRDAHEEDRCRPCEGGATGPVRAMPCGARCAISRT